MVWSSIRNHAASDTVHAEITVSLQDKRHASLPNSVQQAINDARLQLTHAGWEALRSEHP